MCVRVCVCVCVCVCVTHIQSQHTQSHGKYELVKCVTSRADWECMFGHLHVCFHRVSRVGDFHTHTHTHTHAHAHKQTHTNSHTQTVTHTHTHTHADTYTNTW